MRRSMRIAALILVILGGIAIGVGAYNAGVSHGLSQAAKTDQVVRVVGPGFGFPFGLLLFPLFFFAIFALVRGALWRRRWDGGHGHPHWAPGQWAKDGPAMFEDWHRRQHEQATGDHPGAGDEPARA